MVPFNFFKERKRKGRGETSKGIIVFLISLDAISEFFKEEEEGQKEFSQCYEDDPAFFYKGNGEQKSHVAHTEDDSVTKEMRGY